jgi:hypothetical protein
MEGESASMGYLERSSIAYLASHPYLKLKILNVVIFSHVQ